MFIDNHLIPKQIYKAMSLKLDTKEKREKLKKFITKLQSHPSYTPFRDLSHFKDFCFLDYQIIMLNRRTMPQLLKKINTLQRNNNTSFSLNDAIDWMVQIFRSFQDYILIQDPLFQDCQKFIQRIYQFRDEFVKSYDYSSQIPVSKVKQKNNQSTIQKKQKGQGSKETEANQKIVPSSFEQKIQMVFFLKAHQNNQNFIRSVGQNCNIGRSFKQNDKEYYKIKLDDQKTTVNWRSYIRKNDTQ